jgi:hypothetical protein
VLTAATRAMEHDPEKACPALDAGWIPVFGKRSCSKNRFVGARLRLFPA